MNIKQILDGRATSSRTTKNTSDQATTSGTCTTASAEASSGAAPNSISSSSGAMIMHGDLINGLCCTAFFPAYLYMYLNLKDTSAGSSSDADVNSADANSDGPRNICIAFGVTTILNWIAYAYTHHGASSLAFVGMTASIAGMNLYQWPHPEVIIAPQFVWSLLVLVANQPLSYAVQLGLALFATGHAIGISILLQSPEKLPMILGAVAVFGLFQYHSHRRDRLTGVKSSFMSAHVASLILAGAFAYDASYEMLSMYSSPRFSIEGGYNILRIGFFATAGLLASGSFRREIEFKQALEILVQKRSGELQRQANYLQVVEHAMQASETAIAITDPRHKIIWCNRALEQLTNKSIPIHPNQNATHRRPSVSLIEALDLQNLNDVALLEQLYLGRSVGSSSSSSATGRTVTIQGKSIEVEISPYPSNEQNSHSTPRFLVVLRDITERIKREQAEQAAEQEALLSKAMMESMRTLSHELRTPLQSIMGMTSLFLEDDNNKDDDSKQRLPDDAREAMFMVLTSSRLLLVLINNMLDRKKVDAGSMDQFNLSPLPLPTALSEAVEFCRPFASISNVELVIRSSSQQQPVEVHSNPLRFQQIMINLLSNAIKHSPQGGGAKVVISSQVMTLKDAKENLVQSALVVGDAMTNNATSTTATAATTTNNNSPQENDVDECQLVAVISVVDQGGGIPVDQKHKVFRRFAQLEHRPTSPPHEDSESLSNCTIKRGTSQVLAHHQPTGTGLGLNLCTEYVGRMKGEIWVTNQQEEANNRSSSSSDFGDAIGGACFSFYLPLAEAPSIQEPIPSSPSSTRLSSLPNMESNKVVPSELEVANQNSNGLGRDSSSRQLKLRPTLSQPERPAEQVPAQKYRVLVVDDTLINLKVLKRMLTRLAYVERVCTLECGHGALEHLDAPDADYNLVITDIQMPRMNGFELSREIRDRKYSWGPLVVGLTADTSETVEHECIKSGMALVLHKPLTQRGLTDFFESIADQVTP